MSDQSESSTSTKQNADWLWLEQIRDGDDAAWQLLIDQYEGRLLAFSVARINDRSAAEDIVQEAFVGFYRSLPNFDGTRSIEAYLYQICSYKITDFLRRSGKRKMHSFDSSQGGQSSGAAHDPSAGLRMVSSVMRSNERTKVEQDAIVEVLIDQINKWKSKGDFAKLMCMELLIVQGAGNKEVANRLSMSEQQVANYKADFLSRTKTLLSRLNLSREIFPELFE
jgi:RNA polymerase sigma-70 factor, ECF subfamily